MLEKTIADLVREMEREDEVGDTTISKYVKFSLRETVEKIDAYLNSKHISGERDSKGREKPFFNIVTSACNIWYRATDIDRKNIKLRATRQSQSMLSFLAYILLQQWMRKQRFGVFLNEWGRVMARYGSAITKFVEKNGELIPRVMPWNTMIVDPIDFENNPKIEKVYYTPAQLRDKKEYDQEMVEELIVARETRKTMDGQNKDFKSNYIEIFEIHGNMSLSHITDNDEDENDYTQQMHVISYITKKEGTTTKGYDDYTLYRGKEAKDPYMITHLIKEDGRTLSIGAVEHVFEAQWMQNHTTKSIKDQLDLASKLIFQTSDGNFGGQNVLSSIENGDILIHKENHPLTHIANNSNDISALQTLGAMFKQQGNEINGISEAMLGIQAKSGTAWRQTQAELQEAHSLFELMIENKGLAIEDMLRTYVIPHLKKKMDTADEISELLDEYQIKKIDSAYVPAEATKRVNEKIKKDILGKTIKDLEAGRIATPEMQDEAFASEQEAIQGELNKMGSQRFIKPSDVPDKTWKEVLKDFEWETDVDTTGEAKDNEAVLSTLSTVLQTMASFGGQPLPPKMNLVFNKILEHTAVISPLELQEADNQPMPMMAPGQPQQAPQPA